MIWIKKPPKENGLFHSMMRPLYPMISMMLPEMVAPMKNQVRWRMPRMSWKIIDRLNKARMMALPARVGR